MSCCIPPTTFLRFCATYKGFGSQWALSQYNQQDAAFHNLFISVRRSTCFRRVFRPSWAAQNCTYSVRYLSDRYCYLLLAWLATGNSIGLTNAWRCMCSIWAPDDGRKNRLKHVERLAQIHKLWNSASLLVVLYEFISNAPTYEC